MNLKKPKWIWALTFSMCVHTSLGILIFQGIKSKNDELIQTKPMQIETMGEKDYLEKLKAKYIKKKKQIVQMDETLKSDLKPTESQRKFLSKHNQVADQNMKAARLGKFKNVYKQGNPESDAAKLFELPKDMIKAQEEVAPTPETSMTKNHSGRLITPGRSPASLGPKGKGFSATDDYLKDVVIGAQTILNTEEYKYYSFYSRIREALTSQWQMRVRQELTILVNAGANLGGPDKITKLKVELDHNGKLVETEVMRSSGFYELDRAATEAFQAAAPFPHPPKDMIDHSNRVSIDWDFIIFTMQNGGMSIQIKRGGL